MNLIDRVPCDGGRSHTSFGFSVEKQDTGEMLVRFFVFDNFRLADTQWRQEFTNAVTEKIHDDNPDLPVIFSIN